MKTLSKEHFGLCPICGSNWSRKTGTKVDVGQWTHHNNVRLIKITRNGVKYCKCPDCNSVWEAETKRRLSDGEIKSLALR